MSILLRVLPILLIAALAAACGGGDSDESSGTGTDSETRETIEVTAKDFSFTPAKLKGEVGRAFEVTLTNSGDATHTFTIDEFNVNEEVASRTETTVLVTPAEPGEFNYYCRFHQTQGMQGAITVTGEGRAGSGASPYPTPDPEDYGY